MGRGRSSHSAARLRAAASAAAVAVSHGGSSDASTVAKPRDAATRCSRASSAASSAALCRHAPRCRHRASVCCAPSHTAVVAPRRMPALARQPSTKSRKAPTVARRTPGGSRRFHAPGPLSSTSGARGASRSSCRSASAVCTAKRPTSRCAPKASERSAFDSAVALRLVAVASTPTGTSACCAQPYAHTKLKRASPPLLPPPSPLLLDRMSTTQGAPRLRLSQNPWCWKRQPGAHGDRTASSRPMCSSTNRMKRIRVTDVPTASNHRPSRRQLSERCSPAAVGSAARSGRRRSSVSRSSCSRAAGASLSDCFVLGLLASHRCCLGTRPVNASC